MFLKINVRDEHKKCYREDGLNPLGARHTQLLLKSMWI